MFADPMWGHLVSYVLPVWGQFEYLCFIAKVLVYGVFTLSILIGKYVFFEVLKMCRYRRIKDCMAAYVADCVRDCDVLPTSIFFVFKFDYKQCVDSRHGSKVSATFLSKV